MSQLNKLTHQILYKTFISAVLVISLSALIAEFLPEVHAKPLVVSALLLIIGLCITDFLKIRKIERGENKSN
jgi:hypothetical protein